MSESMAATTDRPASTVRAGLTEKQARIHAYLEANLDGRTYFKSRRIAEEIGLSAKEVGTNMRAVREAAEAFDVEKWGYSSGTTWMVTRSARP